MNISFDTIKKVSIASAISLFFFSGAFANDLEDSSIPLAPLPNTYDSMELYNALENVEQGRVEQEIIDVEYELSNEEARAQLDEITKKYDAANLIIQETIEDANGVKTFLIGEGFLGEVKFQAVQAKGQLGRIETLRGRTTDPDIKIQIDRQLRTWQQEQIKVEKFVTAQEEKFSLFGWFVTKL